jgi:hypothetical protein
MAKHFATVVLSNGGSVFELENDEKLFEFMDFLRSEYPNEPYETPHDKHIFTRKQVIYCDLTVNYDAKMDIRKRFKDAVD